MNINTDVEGALDELEEMMVDFRNGWVGNLHPPHGVNDYGYQLSLVSRVIEAAERLDDAAHKALKHAEESGLPEEAEDGTS